jgi:hypothetical protein
MTESLVTARLRSGEALVFEVDEPEDFGVTAISIHVNQETGLIDLDGALGGVRQAAMQVLDTVRSIASPPDSCEISFGLKLSGTLGAIIAKASTEANFTITMVWNAKKKES